MSCALVGLTAGAAGRGGPGTGPRPPPAGGAGRFGGAKGLAAGVAGLGRGADGTGAVEGADDAGAGGAEGAEEDPPFSKLARSRRATGASTVLDADFTYSPSSCSFASTVLLSTPSSFASSCTRALPATTLLTSRPGGKSAPTSLVHLKPGHLRDFIVCSCPSSYLAVRVGRRAPTIGGSDHCDCSGSVAVAGATASASGPVSRTPVRRSARPKARLRSASARQAGSGCRCAPRPGRLRAGSGTALNWSGPNSIATNRSNSEDDARFRQPTQVRTGAAGFTGMPAGGVRRTAKKSTLHFPLAPRPVR
jgi:hypothetical protein